jgi:hypothetical protein
MCLDWLFIQRYGISKPKDLIESDWTEVYNLLNSEFPNAKIYISDRRTKLAPFSEYARFMKWSTVSQNKYIPEYYDCDDFSFALMGDFHRIPEWGCLAFGILWLKKPAHAVNVFIDSNKQIWVVEPQNDNIFKMPTHWEESLVIL